MSARVSQVDHARRIPRQASAFFNREEELTAIRDAFTRSPVVTLIGFGGVGKTRMSLRYAERQADQFPDGVLFIEGDRYESDESLARAILFQIKRDLRTSDPIAALLALLQTMKALVILDGADRYVGSVAPLLATVAGSDPATKFLVTSREPIRITGERLVRLGGLDEASAIALFADRALQSDATFALDEANHGRVASICRHLDGFAFAIELAASWTSTLTLDALEARISGRIAALDARGRHAAGGRYQSLRAVVEGSYDALSDSQQRLFRSLGAFASTFSLAAIVGVAGDDVPNEWALIDDLAVLVDKSFVVSEQFGDGMQYRLVNTLRDYAFARLREAGDAAAVSERVERWCVAQAAETNVTALLPHVEDVRRTVTRALADPKRAGDALALLTMSNGFWFAAGECDFARTRLLELARAGRDLSAESLGTLWLGYASYCEICGCSVDDESAALDEALRVFGETSDSRVKMHVLHALARVRMRVQAFAEASQFASQCIELALLRGDRYQEAMSRRLLATVLFYQRDYVAAEREMTAARDAFDELNVVAFESAARIALAEIQFACGSPESAIRTIEGVRTIPAALKEYYLHTLPIYLLAVGRDEEAVAAAWEAAVGTSGGEPASRSGGVLALAATCAKSDAAIAAKLLGFVDGQPVEWYRKDVPTEAFARRRIEEGAEPVLGRASFERQVALGRGLSIADVDALLDQLRARSTASFAAPAPPAAADDAARGTEPPSELSMLTAREWTIANRVAKGMSNGQIADELLLSRRTVESHVATILSKANIRSRVQLAAMLGTMRVTG